MGNRFDFFHPKRSPMSKYQIPCPFLQRRGFCLKRNACDFSHLKLHMLVKHFKTTPTEPFFTHRRAAEIRQINSISHFPQNNYHQQTWETLPLPQSVPLVRPLMEIAVPPLYLCNVLVTFTILFNRHSSCLLKTSVHKGQLFQEFVKIFGQT